MNGFAIPLKKTDEVCLKLDEIVVQFNDLKNDFMKGYDDAIEEWCRDNPEYESAIRSGIKRREKEVIITYPIFTASKKMPVLPQSHLRLAPVVFAGGPPLPLLRRGCWRPPPS